jgi:hypothetical protein
MKRLDLSVITFLIGLIVSELVMIYFRVGDQNQVGFVNVSYSKNIVFSDLSPHDWQVENSGRLITYIKPEIEIKFLTNAMAKSSHSIGWQQQHTWRCKAHYQLCVKEL